ncbi:DUF4278 domain-containing protein [Oscillatoriales cyanobacterium LEGE 11467]|uniref:DUF4278 domain-containing protein n=1 Tax=Zarconia navalis LEGE 11467 TaxID=1828826 RepID=A0A928VXS9_9CYAN|nr:DUF4278 domain-containing protein [Zarconia navalis LEGE 11467]
MKSSYRRASYASNPHKIDTLEFKTMTTYRGTNYIVRRPVSLKLPNRSDSV